MHIGGVGLLAPGTALLRLMASLAISPSPDDGKELPALVDTARANLPAAPVKRLAADAETSHVEILTAASAAWSGPCIVVSGFC
jgi:hypothetical protein